MAVNSPGDSLSRGIPQANGGNLRAVGAISPTSGISSSTADGGHTAQRDSQTPGIRTVPVATNSPLGQLLDVQA